MDTLFYLMTTLVAFKIKKSGQKIVNVQMTQNKMFPLEVSNVKSYALVAKGGIEANL